MPADVASLRYSPHVMQSSSALNVLIKFHLTIAARLFFPFRVLDGVLSHFPPLSLQLHQGSTPTLPGSWGPPRGVRVLSRKRHPPDCILHRKLGGVGFTSVPHGGRFPPGSHEAPEGTARRHLSLGN